VISGLEADAGDQGRRTGARAAGSDVDRVRVLADIPAAERPTVRVIDPAGPWFKAEIAKRLRKAKGADFSALRTSTFLSEVK
jgi:hypothetical protein